VRLVALKKPACKSQNGTLFYWKIPTHSAKNCQKYIASSHRNFYYSNVHYIARPLAGKNYAHAANFSNFVEGKPQMTNENR
jgi:hypothetical protein